MALDRKSIISGALIAYLTVTAIQAITLSIDTFKGLDFPTALNWGIGSLMVVSAWMILKERKAGFITAFLCLLIVIIWSSSVLIQWPVIGSSVNFWGQIAVNIGALLLTTPYAFRKNGAK